MTRKYRRPLAALLLALAVVATATLGSAATLTVNAATISACTVTHPCPGNATAVPSAPNGSQFTGVTVTLPSTACNNRTVQVTVLNGLTVVAQGEATATGDVAIVPVPDYRAQTFFTVKATVGGWNLPSDWEYDPPPAGLVLVNAMTDQSGVTVGSWTSSGPFNYCVPVTIYSTENGNRPWAVDLDLASAPFAGFIPRFEGAAASSIVPASSPDRPLWLRLTGTGDYKTVHSNEDKLTQFTFTICSQVP